jgi:polyphenol oxidase
MANVVTKKKAARRSVAAKAAPWKLRRAGDLKIFESPALAQISWLTHGFSTRPGGHSELNGACVLNLGFTEWDSRERVTENRGKFFRGLGAREMRPIALRQVHSDIVHRVDASNVAVLSSEPPQGDALFAREPGILLAVQTADCVPILLADTKRRAVAAIHSGWRGTLRRIAAKALGRMQMEFGTEPQDVIAVLGPAIGGCCYEVGAEVAREFDAQFPAAREWFEGPFDARVSGENDPSWLPWLTMRPPGHPLPSPSVHLDLVAANRAILAEAGVPSGRIFASDVCTACRTDLLFSYRREHPTGRMMAAIGIR